MIIHNNYDFNWFIDPAWPERTDGDHEQNEQHAPRFRGQRQSQPLVSLTLLQSFAVALVIKAYMMVKCKTQ